MSSQKLTRVSPGVYKTANGSLVSSSDGKTIGKTLVNRGGGNSGAPNYNNPKNVESPPVGSPPPQQGAQAPAGMATGGGSPGPTSPQNGPALSSPPPNGGAPGGAGMPPGGGSASGSTPFAGFNGLPSLYSSVNNNQDFTDIEGAATGGTINSYNTAANRLRERLDASTQGQANTAQNRSLSRGIGNSGINDAEQANIQSAGQQNYAQGLNDLSDKFETQRQAGLQTALGAANGASQNNNFVDNQLVGLINSNANRSNTIDLANLNNSAAQSRQNSQNAFQGTQNSNSNSLQSSLAQLGYQNQNWQEVFQQLMGQYGQGATSPPGVSAGTPSIGVGGFSPAAGSYTQSHM